ncbi:MAG TPA: hypothetical protein DHV36_16890 [Desulfobacteraceae bacterium]|nr:hypothetical protein [Desulfobacteraceae bacterium]|tara:strand:- start:261 stop:1406 length:1146 start_codon:yes stop_codon:yes gene_type:complete
MTFASQTPPSQVQRYEALLTDIEGSGFHDTMPAIADRMDRWIYDSLLRKDGDSLPLTGLFHRVSQFNAAVTGRIIRDAITLLETQKNINPPLPFCWISMGSDARGEQVIRTDQDNALIYADPPPGEEDRAADYFIALAEGVTRDLDRFGFTYCKGEVMASNPEWCRPLNQWLAALDNWVGSTDPMAVRKLTIFLDFKAVFGDLRLAAMLQKRVFQNFGNHSSASHFLARDDQLFAAPKTRLGRIRTRREGRCKRCFNLKTQALAHIVNGARLFAVNHGIQIPATLKRLEQLGEDGILSQEEAWDFSRAFEFLTRLKLINHLESPAGRPCDRAAPPLPANCIDLSRLEKEDLKRLDRALDAVTRFQKKMTATYNQAWMNFFN